MERDSVFPSFPVGSLSFLATSLSGTDTLVPTRFGEKVWFSNKENSLSLDAGEYKVRIIRQRDTLKTFLFSVKPGANCGPQEAIELLGGVKELTRLKFGKTNRTKEEIEPTDSIKDEGIGQYALISLDPVKLGEFSLDSWYNFGTDGAIEAFWRESDKRHVLQAATVVEDNSKRKYAKVSFEKDGKKDLGDGVVLFKAENEFELRIYGEENFTQATVYVRYFNIK